MKTFHLFVLQLCWFHRYIDAKLTYMYVYLYLQFLPLKITLHGHVCASLSQIFLLLKVPVRYFHSLSGRSRGHASFIYMCPHSLSKADLSTSMNHIRHPTDFSTAHLHFGSESIVPMLFPLSSHIPRVFVCQILGKLLGLTHSTKRQWRNTLAQMCLSSFLPSLYALPPSLLLSVWAWLRSAQTHDYRNAVCGSQLRQP